MRYRINLETDTDVHKFVELATMIDEPVYLTDKDRLLVVSAKSILGANYARIEWHNLFIECERDMYYTFLEFMAD